MWTLLNTSKSDSTLASMALKRMDNVGIVFEDLKAAIAFFTELGLSVEGEMSVEGKWVDKCVGLEGVRTDIAVMRTPDGHSKIELMQFHHPKAIAPQPRIPSSNTLGMGRIMFAVDDIDDTVTRLGALGGKVLDEIVQYENAYRLCYMRGPEGIIIALAQQLN